MGDDHLVYRIMREDDVDEVISLTAKTFSAGEPLFVFNKSKLDDVLPFAIDASKQGVGSGLSFVCEDLLRKPGDRIVGFRLSRLYSSDIIGVFSPALFTLLNGLSKIWLEQNRGVDLSKVVYYLALGTRDGYEGRGIATKITASSIVHNKSLGYERAFVIASATGSQKVFEKLGFQKVTEVFYKDFEFEGKKPFENIVEPKSIIAYTKIF